MRTVWHFLRRVLLWLLGVALGTAVLLGAVMAASYSFTTSGSLPASEAQFGGAALTVNGSRWRVPLVGGMLDKAFYSPSTLSVEKLGVLYEAHPEITLPEWATYATLRITADGMGDAAYFDGPVEDYAAFLPVPRERTAASVRSSSRVLTRSRIIQRSISSRLKSRRFSPIL